MGMSYMLMAVIAIDIELTAISMAAIYMTMAVCPMSMGLTPMMAERRQEAPGIGAIMGLIPVEGWKGYFVLAASSAIFTPVAPADWSC